MSSYLLDTTLEGETSITVLFNIVILVSIDISQLSPEQGAQVLSSRPRGTCRQVFERGLIHVDSQSNYDALPRQLSELWGGADAKIC